VDATPQGNTDPSNLGFDANADVSGTINITC
jgi:hypothetical protein